MWRPSQPCGGHRGRVAIIAAVRRRSRQVRRPSRPCGDRRRKCSGHRNRAAAIATVWRSSRPCGGHRGRVAVIAANAAAAPTYCCLPPRPSNRRTQRRDVHTQASERPAGHAADSRRVTRYATVLSDALARLGGITICGTGSVEAGRSSCRYSRPRERRTPSPPVVGGFAHTRSLDVKPRRHLSECTETAKLGEESNTDLAGRARETHEVCAEVFRHHMCGTVSFISRDAPRARRHR